MGPNLEMAYQLVPGMEVIYEIRIGRGKRTVTEALRDLLMAIQEILM
jgi:hypothetical protein